MARIIGIVGMDPSSAREANKAGPEVELWALNEAYVTLQRPAARWFQLHQRVEGQFDMQRPGGGAVHEDFLRNCPVPVYMIDKDPMVPTSVRYPLEELLDEFGHYFTSTMAYMVALAIHEGCDELRIYGVALDKGIEYVEQKAGMEYFLGIAKGRGIKVVLPTQSPLLHAPLYGRDDKWQEHENLQLRYASLRVKYDKCERELRELKIRIEECEMLMIIGGQKPRSLFHLSEAVARDPSQEGNGAGEGIPVEANKPSA